MGWLADGTSVFEGYKYQDFAGSSVVHLCGGVIALWGAIFCGPRIGRFSDNHPNDIQGHSIPVSITGNATIIANMTEMNQPQFLEEIVISFDFDAIFFTITSKK